MAKKRICKNTLKIKSLGLQKNAIFVLEAIKYAKYHQKEFSIFRQKRLCSYLKKRDYVVLYLFLTILHCITFNDNDRECDKDKTKSSVICLKNNPKPIWSLPMKIFREFYRYFLI